jgi:pyruvate ferredoxin oxidoreductase beta subunit
MYEMENGEVTQARKIKDPRLLEEYLRGQKRFKHLFTMEGGEEEIKKIQATAEWNIKHYGLQ